MPTSITFQHGVYTQELPTAIVPLTSVEAPTVAFGTAPIHLATDPAPANVPILCSTLAEFAAQFGWSNDFDKFTLCEVAKCHFSLYNVAPVIFVNVLDPLKHAINGTQEVTSVTSTVKLEGHILLETLKITSGSESENNHVTFTNSDFSATHDSDGNTLIQILNPNKIVDDAISISYRELDTTAVNSQTVIGGVDLLSGKSTGLEVIEDVYPRLGVAPGTIIAPKFSTDPAVALVMAGKSTGINGCFKSLAVADLNTTSATKYTDVSSVKSGSNFSDSHLIACWPKVALGGEQYHLSTQIAALMNVVDAEHDLIPYKSPSNEFLKCDSSVLADGSEVLLGRDLANYVNSQGVLTALNFGGFRAWGVYNSKYPNDSDPINFISVRRMMNWICNALTQNFFSRIDSPMNRVLIDSVLDSARIWLNGLAAKGAILGGDIGFLEEDNPATELSKGHMTFRLNVGFCVPAVKINFVVQFDPSYFSTLFSS